MNKQQLAAQLIDQSHRPDLVSKTDTFIELAEGMIARDVRAMEQITVVYLDDTMRTDPSTGIYTLPTSWLIDRALWLQGSDGSTIQANALEKKSLAELRRFSGSMPPLYFSVRGANIEFRGVPAEGVIIEAEYYQRMPALVNDADTNELLTNHPELYLSAGLFFLYRYTQDTEIIAGFNESFQHAAKMLNELAATKIGGNSTAPAYNFYSQPSY